MSETTLSLEQLDSDLVRLQLAASAIAENKNWDGYNSNVKRRISVLSPEDDTHAGDRDFQLRVALSNGDKNSLIALASDSYLGKRLQDPYPVIPAFVADDLDAFALELQRVGAKKTHAGALVTVMDGIRYGQEQNRYTDTALVNTVMENLRLRRRDHLFTLGLKTGGVLLAGIAAKRLVS